MASFEAGSYVTHAKMPDLGTGEVLSNEKGTMRVRFASGERVFATAVAEAYLEISQDAPPSPTPAKRASKKKAAGGAAKKKSIAARSDAPPKARASAEEAASDDD